MFGLFVSVNCARYLDFLQFCHLTHSQYLNLSIKDRRLLLLTKTYDLSGNIGKSTALVIYTQPLPPVLRITPYKTESQNAANSKQTQKILQQEFQLKDPNDPNDPNAP